MTARPIVRSLPDFLCIGAQKAGTTWLYRNLKIHPDVWLPPEKEIHYFDEKLTLEDERARGGAARRQSARHRRPKRTKVERTLRDWRQNASRSTLRWHLRNWGANLSPSALRWRLRYSLGRPDDAWYVSLFQPGADRVTGEMTPGYAVLPSKRVAHIRELIPEARILFFMRNPIERAWSHAGMHVRQGFIDEEATAIRQHFYSDNSLERTNYIATLDVWSEFFPAAQIFVGFVEDIQFYPRELLSRVCGFLGIGDIARSPYMHDRVYTRSGATIPADFARELATLHADLVSKLSDRLGGYADWWRFCCDRLSGCASADDVRFPLCESPLWLEWLAGDAPRLQSDVLERTEYAPSQPSPSPRN